MLYQSKIDLSTKNNSHTLAHESITSLLNNKQGRILEVGCSSGYFGASLRACGHVVWGIEPFQNAAQAARDVLDHVYVGDIQSFFNDFPNERFDVVVFGDVLEHIDNPVSILQKCREFLNPNGRVVASIPNVSHLAIRTMLLEGRWDYSDLGILDRTHLRFFTRDSAIGMFSDAGYQVHQISPVRLPAEQVDAICHLGLNPQMLNSVTQLVRDDCAYDFQYVISAEPLQIAADAPKKNENIKAKLGLRVVCLVPNPTLSLVDIRLRQPLERWTIRSGGHFRVLETHHVTVDDIAWGDVFVIQREVNPLAVKLLEFLQAHGKKVIFEIDDLLCDLPHFLKHHIESFERSRPYFEQVLSKSDAVTVTTDRLGAALTAEGGRTFVIPNCAETHMPELAAHSQVPTNQISLMVASSDRVLVDFLVPALIDVQSRLGVQIIAVGPPADKLIEAGLVVQAHPNMSYHMFKSFVAAQTNCVGLIPLDDSRFSACKSPIKFFDYALAGVPSICSAVPPYADVIQDGVNGILSANTTEDWIRHIEALVSDAQARDHISRGARQLVATKFNMDIAAAQWNTLLERLIPDVRAYRNHTAPILASDVMGLLIDPWSRVAGLVKRLFRPSAYIKAFDIFCNQGPKAVVVKIVSLVKPR
jgi:2-polyprenyl-3-methyl-5-hydroxy-6-metoxy-1,4-benzoquinol methylase